MSDKKTLIYDCLSAPNTHGVNFEQVVKMFREHGVVVWTSEFYGEEPKVVSGEIHDIRFLDLGGMTKEEIDALMKKYE